MGADSGTIARIDRDGAILRLSRLLLATGSAARLVKVAALVMEWSVAAIGDVLVNLLRAT